MRQLWFDVRWIAASVTTWAENLGYLVRPYDMLADRRRWFWQRRQPCGRSPEALAMSRDFAIRRLAAGLDVPRHLLNTAVPERWGDVWQQDAEILKDRLRGSVEHVDVDIPGIGRVIGAIDRDPKYRIDLAAGDAPVPNQYTELFANDPAIPCGYPAPVIDEHAVDAFGTPLRCTRQAGHETVGDGPDRLNHTNPARPDWAWRTRKERSMNLNELAAQIHVISRSKGFWEGERNPAAVLMLIVSEAVEALEEIRDGHELNEARVSWVSGPDFLEHRVRLGSHTIEALPGGRKVLVEQIAGHERRTLMTPEKWLELGYKAKPEGVPSEMADLLIRVLDACAAWDIDIDAAVAEKMAYNEGRPHLHGRAGVM